MATPFAINTGSTISGTTQIGDIAVGDTAQDYSSGPGGVQWYMGPDDDLGYVVTRPDLSFGHTSPAGGNPGLSFRRSEDFTESSLLELANSISSEEGGTGFTTTSGATIWFGEQGFYSSFNDLRFYLDAVNTNSYPGTGTTWYDLSGYENTGTLINTPSLVDDHMTFAGSDYVNIGKKSSLLIGGDCTISAWVMITATGTYYGIYGGSNDNGSPRRGVTLGKWSDNKLCLFIGTNDANYVVITANAAMVPNVWYYVVGRLEAGVMNLFVNGVLQNETLSSVVLYPTADDSVIGRWYGTYDGFYFQGSIDVVKMSNMALSNTEILQNFNALRLRFGL